MDAIRVDTLTEGCRLRLCHSPGQFHGVPVYGTPVPNRMVAFVPWPCVLASCNCHPQR